MQFVRVPKYVPPALRVAELPLTVQLFKTLSQTPPPYVAELPVTVQLSKMPLETAPPYPAELPVHVQWLSMLPDAPPPDSEAELARKTQLVSVEAIAPPP